MKSVMIILRLVKITIILAALTIISCEKSTIIDPKDLLATWVSKDLVDTVEFTSDTTFSKMFSGSPDYFKYELSKDSITIQYSGKLFIYVPPTTHYIQLNDTKLTIDFSNGCYGFRKQVIDFNRK